ncbi:Iron(II)-dependent oxidoreductase EgtB [Bordetella ansorpii]|uniref:Iron(II)-dependent oxidoreductase EgtB n=1 Tax=Bordetella ansorpii TaxID=288768 RepID=A0A157QAT4_9BORD|nr:ergothioneine biosynthesis protein EgtB [Bordetella ansorpii]SAI42656.1 Iron(II)-dependent oxidoreductase EgtB [Bordetella ansorpii]SAI74331.1 Iron(II)-dependent oxidoreductase EgtB [Bordetella ansorpii]
MDPSCLLTHPGAAASALPRAERTASQRYEGVRGQSVALAAPLSPEDCQAQSMPDCSPVKWHLAHTTWFFETFVIGRFDPGRAPFHPQYRMLFNSYYNAIGDKHPRPQRGLLTRPPLADVLRYREHVDAAMHTLLARHAGDAEFEALVILGLNHEQQHQELILTDLKHLLSCNPLRPAYREESPAGSLPPGTRAGWTRYDGGIVRLGHEGAGFAFDNESPAHDALLRPYCLANRLVTQGEYLEFMLDGGYRRPEFWLSLGWDMVNSAGWRAPMYWEGQKRDWQAFTLHGMQPIDPHAPVTHVSYFEADAYARWARARLPREGEWEHAARLRDAALAGTGSAQSEGRANMLESGHLQPRSAPAGDGAGPSQMYGDVWEWTSSSYDAYPGFMPPEGAVGEYNGKFMCNQYVLRGGSCATPRDHIRASYRNFFPADARWQFSGIRLALDAS